MGDGQEVNGKQLAKEGGWHGAELTLEKSDTLGSDETLPRTGQRASSALSTPGSPQ